MQLYLECTVNFRLRAPAHLRAPLCLFKAKVKSPPCSYETTGALTRACFTIFFWKISFCFYVNRNIIYPRITFVRRVSVYFVSMSLLWRNTNVQYICGRNLKLYSGSQPIFNVMINLQISKYRG